MGGRGRREEEGRAKPGNQLVSYICHISAVFRRLED